MRRRDNAAMWQVLTITTWTFINWIWFQLFLFFIFGRHEWNFNRLIYWNSMQLIQLLDKVQLLLFNSYYKVGPWPIKYVIRRNALGISINSDIRVFFAKKNININANFDRLKKFRLNWNGYKIQRNQVLIIWISSRAIYYLQIIFIHFVFEMEFGSIAKITFELGTLLLSPSKYWTTNIENNKSESS